MRAAIYGFLLLSAAGPACAFEFVSVAEPAILYDAPSLKARKLYVATRYLPLEQIVSLNNWVKVRDKDKHLYWIEKRALSSKHFVVVTAAVAAVHEKPDAQSATVFMAPQQLALECQQDAGDGWLKILHADGTSGYIKATEVWGN